MRTDRSIKLVSRKSALLVGIVTAAWPALAAEVTPSG